MLKYWCLVSVYQYITDTSELVDVTLADIMRADVMLRFRVRVRVRVSVKFRLLSF